MYNPQISKWPIRILTFYHLIKTLGATIVLQLKELLFLATFRDFHTNIFRNLLLFISFTNFGVSFCVTPRKICQKLHHQTRIAQVWPSSNYIKSPTIRIRFRLVSLIRIAQLQPIVNIRRITHIFIHFTWTAPIDAYRLFMSIKGRFTKFYAMTTRLDNVIIPWWWKICSCDILIINFMLRATGLKITLERKLPKRLFWHLVKQVPSASTFQGVKFTSNVGHCNSNSTRAYTAFLKDYFQLPAWYYL